MSKFDGEVPELHATAISGRMYDFYEQKILCNIDLVVGNNKFAMHKLILITNSDFFKSRINDTTTEIILEDSDDILAESVKKTIKFFYCGEIDLQLHQVVNIVKLSKMIEARELEKYCLAYLEKIRDSKNFIFIEDFAKQYGYLQLLEQTKAYITGNFLKIIQEDEFLNMSCERLGELLQLDDLNVAREEQVFQGLKIWVQKNFEFRKTHLDTLMKYIRLPFLSVQFILNEVKPLCYGSLSCRQMVLDTLEYHRYSDNGLQLSTLKPKPRKYKKPALIIARSHNLVSDEIEIYNAEDDSWSVYDDLDNGTVQFGAVIWNNKLITMGGLSEHETINKVFCLDLSTKETTELQAMHKKRKYFAATIIDDQIFVLGGHDEKHNSMNSVERYNLLTNTWTNRAHMLTPRCLHEVAVVGKDIYVIGGCENSIFGINKMDIYNTQLNKWTRAPRMKYNRYFCAAVAMGDHIYAIGGHNGISLIKSVERFDIKSRAWTSLANFPILNYGMRAIAFNEKIICTVLGLVDSTLLLKYDPDTDEWINLE
ncbi:kelch-like protein 28 [Arctopsyche grandis]|uniref:kelch-like protein 28 n=1 Tax=Arctopsyche grandis TaxID=121162 RepID=UPI00406D79FE